MSEDPQNEKDPSYACKQRAHLLGLSTLLTKKSRSKFFKEARYWGIQQTHKVGGSVVIFPEGN
jgi:hypothetical protein